MLKEALQDINSAIILLESNTPSNCDIRRVMIKLKEEILLEISPLSGRKLQSTEFTSTVNIAETELVRLRQLASSTDTLHEIDAPKAASVLSESGYSSNI